MKFDLLNKKFPTLVGILILVIGIGFTTFLVKGNTLFEINAGPGQDPEQINITNITNDTFTLSYITDAMVIGTINYGANPNSLESLALDDRDQLSQSVTKRKSHSITVRKLQPETTYYFSITSGDKIFLNNDSPFNTKTGSVITESPTDQIPITGKVLLPDGSSPSDGLVYIATTGTQDLSTYLKKDGTYTIPLNTIRNSPLNKFFDLTNNTIINITIKSSNLSTTIDVPTSQINPVPTVSLSGNYDFSDSSQTTNLDNNSSESAILFPEFGIKQEVIEPKILTPSEGEQLSGQLPTFEGTAQPNEEVIIEIHSDENISTQVVTNETGDWTYTPPSGLSEGEHTITITTINSIGVIQIVTKTFTVPKAQGQVVTNTPTPIQSTSPTPAIIATSSTPIPTTLLSPTIAPVSQTTISPTPTPQPTGNSSSVIFAALIGIGATISGTFLYLYTRKRKTI